MDELTITLSITKEGYADASFEPPITDEQLDTFEESLQELYEAVREALAL